ncbi:ATP-dependent helicase [Salipaludibacillus neizhouensis]|uniref:ATP-dependent helicase n=1 Tax=Salipaludibacillus neizhouensis TaxID=885475 RepID=A0A3A9K3H1_9BACI|nr:AAA domain-containing protein [Salipaludibacillus neizhouensis]RKL65420.1 ATP-dependent helicase [Salipaludibacillus neizhouensis]
MKLLNKTYRCPITLTNKAKDKMGVLGIERSFFSLERSFRVYIEKYPQTADRPLSAALFFDNVENKRLADMYDRLVIILHCVVEKDCFIVTNVTKKSARSSVRTNWRQSVDLTFDLSDQRGRQVPFDLLNLLHDMPVAQEISTYVKKRMTSWEGYLKIQERSADIPDMVARFTSLAFNDDFSRVTIKGCELNDKEWKSLRNLSVKLKGLDQDIGKVLKANRSARTVEVEVNKYMEKRAREQQLDLPQKEVIFSNFAALSQVKRLRQGFKHLEDGLAANPELEQLLFENKPPVQTPKKIAPLKFHNRLNEFQQEAVQGAVASEDLYVIQGPPGTGKTTVISEICLQNARAGLRTLVASQSNLAVDNALGRLLENKDIRILRVGRTESIEEEGKKFMEENVGQYWKDHTLKEVSTQFEARHKREKELETEWTENEAEQERLKPVLARLEAEVEAKKKAKEQHHEIETFLKEQKKKVDHAEKEQQHAQSDVQEIEQTLRTLTDLIEEDKNFLREVPEPDTIKKEIEDNQQVIQKLQQSIAVQALEDKISEQKQTLDQATTEYEKFAEAIQQTDALIIKVTESKQVDTLRWMVLEQKLERTLDVQQLFEEIKDIREEINQFQKLKEYNDTLNRAISYLEQRLNEHHTPTDKIQQRALHRLSVYTADEIDQFLDELRSKLNGQQISVQVLVSDLEGLYSRRHFVRQKAERLTPFDTNKQLAQEAFGQVKQKMLGQLHYKQSVNNMSHEKWQLEKKDEDSALHSLQESLKQMLETAERIPNAKDLLPQKEEKMLELKKKHEQYKQVKEQLETNRKKQEEESVRLQEEKKKLGETEARLEQWQSSITQKQEEQLLLNDILETDPESEHEDRLKQWASLAFRWDSLKKEKERLPVFQSIQGQWLSLLEEANEHDLEEIRKLYVKHANVIGTTCVASARKDFIDSYPEFDVVIIDEVSKATPPELLLPMLKGKKIVLVGDHHQLPPLLGNDTLEETLQEMADDSDDFEGKVELKKLLKESLFERLFKSLPKQNKTMLAIQYRMHENIMEAIAPFYEQENERLQCGLTDSAAQRDHLLESPLVQRNNHLLWLDVPNEPLFFEERMKGGKSLYNSAELRRIEDLLKELDEATAQAKQTGKMNADEKKSIGVISFYGEQVKKIDRLIHQVLRLDHLTVRTGTVDRFQGMEMDVILLSMVRNHDNKQADIGFANDYRRLNVALSRAKELLVLIGSIEMFTKKAKQADTRKMYTHVLEAVKKQDGLRELEGVVQHG